MGMTAKDGLLSIDTLTQGKPSQAVSCAGSNFAKPSWQWSQKAPPTIETKGTPLYCSCVFLVESSRLPSPHRGQGCLCHFDFILQLLERYDEEIANPLELRIQHFVSPMGVVHILPDAVIAVGISPAHGGCVNSNACRFCEIEDCPLLGEYFQPIGLTRKHIALDAV